MSCVTSVCSLAKWWWMDSLAMILLRGLEMCSENHMSQPLTGTTFRQ
jgi:hypothetical protein